MPILESLSAPAQTIFLAALAYELTVCSQATFDLEREKTLGLTALRGFNGLQHRVTLSLRNRMIGRKREPLDDILKAILEFRANYSDRNQLDSLLESSLQALTEQVPFDLQAQPREIELRTPLTEMNLGPWPGLPQIVLLAKLDSELTISARSTYTSSSQPAYYNELQKIVSGTLLGAVRDLQRGHIVKRQSGDLDYILKKIRRFGKDHRLEEAESTLSRAYSFIQQLE